MEKRRVLIVDDSAFTRKMVTMAIESDVDLEPYIAPNGAVALTKIERLHPDCVVLDMEMPDKDGQETFAKIRSLHPGLPIILFSADTQFASTCAMKGLADGAMDCVLKPGESKDMQANVKYIQENLLGKIRGLCHLSPKFGYPKPVIKVKPPPPIAFSAQGRIELVVIGVSTGGPNALAAVVPHFPKDIGVPVLIVQHMPPMFTKLLAERLAGICPMHCREAQDGEIIGPGDLRLAPGNYHMTVTRQENRFQLHLNQNPPENSCRPAVDVLFRHAAECAPGKVLGVILTGMGQDGLRGSETLKSRGGYLLAQDEPTSVVWGMPGAVVQAGLTDKVLPLQDIGPEILKRLQGGKA